MALSICLLVSGVAAPAAAEPATALPEIERAYAEIDLERARELAQRALAAGGREPRETARLYWLWAMSAAALGRHDEARAAFTHVLAIDPRTRLEKSLSPKLRAPYLEARGALGSQQGSDAPPLSVEVRPTADELTLELRDVLGVARRLELSTRGQGGASFDRRSFEPRPETRASLPKRDPKRALEYFVRVLDEHGNVLFERGSAATPSRLATPALALQQPRAAKPEHPSATPFYVTAGALATLGVAAGAGAAFFYLEREDAAQAWNGPSCERPGSTRAAQCAGVDQRRRHAEQLAIGLTAGSGALLLGGVLTLLLAPSPSATRVNVQASSSGIRLQLVTTL